MRPSFTRRGACAVWTVLALLLAVPLTGIPTLVSPACGAKPLAAPKPLAPPKVGPKQKLPAALRKSAPSSVEDLEAIEKHVQKLLPKLSAATVGIRAGRAQGSGVIVSPDGYVLTAGHVSASAGRKVTLIFPNEKTVKGETLGAFHTADAGLIKITTPGKWPHVPLGDMNDLQVGDWCLALGHPGGFQKGRPPVIRLGRVIRKLSHTIQTDAVLVGGDSGGPLFDMHGRVIGINSRIGPPTTSNYHAAVSAYAENWSRLRQGEVWGSRKRSRAIMGVNGEDHPKGCRVTGAPDGYPAAKAGIKVGDIITKFDGKRIKSFRDLILAVSRKSPGDKVTVEILRNGGTMQVTLRLAKR